MEKDALSAGVSKVGGLFSTAEIKILVCYILSALNAPVPGRMLADVLHYEGIANCFEVNDAIAALCESGHLKPADEKDDTYVITDNGRQIFITGHSEYDADTLKQEYLRDKNQGLDIKMPQNYFPDNDDTREPIVTWRSHANLIYQNWLNYFVYQATPYAIDSIGPVI